MIINGLPKKQGLYDPIFEHDACGIGTVVNIKGKKSHKIVEQALTILINLSHRGGLGAEANTGDGAGILVQIPHLFLSEACLKEGFCLPSASEYGVGMLFLSQNEEERLVCEKTLAQIIKDEDQELLGFREVPYNTAGLGETALRFMPHIKQVFIKKSKGIQDALTFERKLYIIRKRIENEMHKQNIHFYAASFSSKTIVYKGMLTADQVGSFYEDLKTPSFETALALVHSRFSTNTFPSWERAHPNRYIIHNGEINTLQGNINWMHARGSMLKSDFFKDEMHKVLPVINGEGSDSAMFDNCFEFLSLTGRSMAHSAMMMIPEPWSHNKTMNDEKRAFYEYHATLMEPWDGPAAIVFTDGEQVGAILDRNGLRPARYYVTKDDTVILASEVGVLDIEPSDIICKERLHPGKMLLIDTNKGIIISDEALKHAEASEHPYRSWVNEYLIEFEKLPKIQKAAASSEEPLIRRQKTFGYTFEDLKTLLIPMVKEGLDPVGAMGNDTPLAVLSDKPQLLYNYFKQLFAQVTNPPIDALREEIVTGTETYLFPGSNIASQLPESCKNIRFKSPLLSNEELALLAEMNDETFKAVSFPILFNPSEGGAGLEKALDKLFEQADTAITDGFNIIILSDKAVNEEKCPIPALLAVSGLHHHLIRKQTRTKVGIVLESGEPREVHHFAALIGYGVTAVNPYLAYESIADVIQTGLLTELSYDEAVKIYIKTVTKSVVKILSKMGISTIQSYQGAQIFEALGINQSVIDKYFTRTASRIEGLGLEEIAKEAALRHHEAYFNRMADAASLDSAGNYQWRAEGEYHLFNPETIHKLQHACRTNDYKLFKEYSELINHQTQKLCTIRGLMAFKNRTPISIDEVESVESICRRFKTGAMSYGSISQEAHESLAIAMNRLGGKSNTGEGGEEAERFIKMVNGDSKCSAIKQVASGRFGVTSHYLVNAEEIQIKMAQGAKPGEGGQLPGKKVYPWVAHARNSTPGVGLISPPPHHDIYSIEDLAELIHDLKNANRSAKINVKLVSEVGVGTIAAGVAKGRADVVLISGYDGGTGASPRTSIRHAGLPWELGLAETHQTLLLNNLRSRIKVETDGKLMTGRDLAIAALLGAEEYGFATAPLVVLGCVMMRVCNLDTCPVGVATQNPELRKKFTGDPQHVVNFLQFVAEELREIMAELGFKTINEMIGRTDKLEMTPAISHWKAQGLDYANILFKPEGYENGNVYCTENQDHELELSLDLSVLIEKCRPALEQGKKVNLSLPIKNTNRVVGTILGSEVTKRYGADGLPEDTINLEFTGSAGQSFGAFVPKGITLKLEGDANDYIGKGLSGGKIVVCPPKDASFVPEENIIIGNVAFYGATGGEAYIRGAAGERFCVRNSGLKAVVGSVGDHGCEYMTGGRVVILGSVGRNFAAGMSGGVAYVLDEAGIFKEKCNMEMVQIDTLTEKEEIAEVHKMIKDHLQYTDSSVARKIIDDWDNMLPKFVRVMPIDYKEMLDAIKRAEADGLTGEDALLAAFQETTNPSAAAVK